MALTTTSLTSLSLIAKGKVRDIYAIPSDPLSLLFVATDRVSPFFHDPRLTTDFGLRCHPKQRISSFLILLLPLTPGDP